jgi:hypothetical protein
MPQLWGAGVIYFDTETRSTLDVTEVGAHAMAADPTLQIISMHWAFDDGPVQHWRGLFSDGVVVSLQDPPPVELFDRIAAGEDIAIWNDAFDRLVWNAVAARRHGMPHIKMEQVIDAAAVARSHNIPGKLENAAANWLPPEMRKLGNQSFRPLWSHHTPLLPSHAGLYAEMLKYGDHDVIAMRAILKRLLPWDATTRRDYLAAERINMRGVGVDLQWAAKAVTFREAITADVGQRLSDLTGGEITSVSQYVRHRKWAEAQMNEAGFTLVEEHMSVTKKKLRADGAGYYTKVSKGFDKNVRAKIREVLEDEAPRNMDCPQVLELIDLLDEAAGSAAVKYAAALDRANGDGVLRGMYIWSGASQTGRFSAGGMQPHNLIRKSVKDPSGTIERLLEATPEEAAEIAAGEGLNLNALLGRLLRPTLVPRNPDNCLVWADWSAIEARVCPWLSGSPDAEPLLDLFRRGEDVYLAAAEDIVGHPVQKDDIERQLGKVACLAGDTLVLVKTISGKETLKAITDVLISDMTWDGVEWVHHDGVVSQGTKACVSLSGMKLTSDHLIWCGPSTGWMPAGEVVSSESTQSQASASAWGSLSSLDTSSGRAAGFAPSSFNATADSLNTGLTPIPSCRGGRFGATPAGKSKPLAPVGSCSFITRASALIWNIAVGSSTASPPSTPAAAAPDAPSGRHMVAEASAAGGWTSMGRTPPKAKCPAVGTSELSSGAWRCSAIWSRLMGGTSRLLNWIGLTTTATTHRAISAFAASPSTPETSVRWTRSRPASSNLRQNLPVFDLLNAGPRSRFTVWTDDGPLIVHNCLSLGFGGAVGAYAAMAKNYGIPPMPRNQVQDIVDKWREANPWAREWWDDLWTAAMAAINYPCEEFKAGRVSFTYLPALLDGVLIMWLPCGRPLFYPSARIQNVYKGNDERPETGITFQHAAFGRVPLWYGQLAENATQATAASLLREALVDLELGDPWRGDVVAHTHDEIVAECAVEDVKHVAFTLECVMGYVPTWAPGLPLAAEVKAGWAYYEADKELLA